MTGETTMFQSRKVSRRRFLTTASALAASTLLAACGKPLDKFGFGDEDGRTPPAGSGGDIQHPTGSDELVLRIDRTGGLLPVWESVTALPIFSLYGDGRVITQGPQIAIYPEPALPNLRVSRLNEEGIQVVLQEAQEAGLLDGDKTYDEPASRIADAGTTVFTTTANGQTSTVSVYALGASDEEISAEAREIREKLSAFVQDTQSLQTWLPESAFAEFDSAYQIERLQLVSQPADRAPTDEREPDPQTKQWPLDTPLSRLGEPFTLPASRCFVVEGADLQTMLDALQDANRLTRWRSEGNEYLLYVRPLLPDEEGCSHPDDGQTNGNGQPGGGTGQSGAIGHPTDADELVLRIEQTGGFVPLDALVTRMPGVSLYGDGRFIVTGPQIEIFPPPALPNLLVTELSEEGIQAILQEAQHVGLLDGDATYEDVPVADATTTVFTVNAGGQTSTVSVYALGMGDEIEGISDEERQIRRKLQEFSARMMDLPRWLPESAIVEPETDYQIERLQLVSQPSHLVPVPDPNYDPGHVEWPLSMSLAELGEPYFLEESRCFVVEGDDAQTLLDALANANTLTRWESDGETYVLHVRPLLPDEEGCNHPDDRPAN